MPTTTANAVDEMLGLVWTAALALSPALHIEWEGLPSLSNEPPPQDKEWIRAGVKHDPSGSSQGSLSCQHGVRRWRREGQLYVQCFAPIKAGGLKRSMEMACAFRDAIQGASTPGGVWFRRVTAREVGPHNSLYQSNTSARFQYDEVK